MTELLNVYVYIIMCRITISYGRHQLSLLLNVNSVILLSNLSYFLIKNFLTNLHVYSNDLLFSPSSYPLLVTYLDSWC